VVIAAVVEPVAAPLPTAPEQVTDVVPPEVPAAVVVVPGGAGVPPPVSAGFAPPCPFDALFPDPVGEVAPPGQLAVPLSLVAEAALPKKALVRNAAASNTIILGR
jgi:hypothetical protein